MTTRPMHPASAFSIFVSTSLHNRQLQLQKVRGTGHTGVVRTAEQPIKRTDTHGIDNYTTHYTMRGAFTLEHIT